MSAVADDRRLIPLVLRMFEIDHVGAQFDARPFWSATMAELAMRGRVLPWLSPSGWAGAPAIMRDIAALLSPRHQPSASIHQVAPASA